MIIFLKSNQSNLSTYLFIYISGYLAINLLHNYLFIYLLIYLPIYIRIHLLFQLCIYLFIYTRWKRNKCHPFNSRRGRLKGPRNIQDVTGPHRQNDKDDRPCREDRFLWRNIILANMSFLSYAHVSRCSPVRVGIEYKQLYTYRSIEKGTYLQYVFKQSALCLIACLISSQQLSADTAEQQVLLVQSTVVVTPKEKIKGALNQALRIATTEWGLTAQIIISSACINW